MATERDLTDLREEMRGEFLSMNDEVRSQLLEMRQALQSNIVSPDSTSEGDNILLDASMRDSVRQINPRIEGAGHEINNNHFRDLSNHELHQIKKIHEKDHSMKKKTILDEKLGDIMDKCIHFLLYSFEGYSKKYYEAEIMEDVFDSEKTTYDTIKVNLIASVLFIKEDENILYIGILLVFFSMIIYLLNITTS
jgi:hypothetical protein